MTVAEGKSVIADTGYIALAAGCRDICLKPRCTAGEFQASTFAWAWLTMQWNLVSRSVSVQDLQLEHLDWHGDALKVCFAKSKGKFGMIKNKELII